MRPIVAALLLVLACLTLTAATAKTSLPEVERDVMCTTCSVPLLVADAPAADAMRREIRRLVDRGLTKREIEDRLIDIYGEQVLIIPRDGGLSIASSVVPAALVALAALLVASIALGWRRRSRAQTGGQVALQAAELSAKDASRVEADLRRHGL